MSPAPELTTCATCGGVYQAKQPDGGNYFHSCPGEKLNASGKLVTIDSPVNQNPPTDAKPVALKRNE